MEDKRKTPYVCHIVVCINDREGSRKSCADGDSPLIRSRLKDIIKERGWEGRVRVSQSLCMGLCAKGPNVVMYPQQIWYPDVNVDDVDQIISDIEEILG